ncbi:MAG: hypothetical protein HY216_09990 [Candidatus Rokubacteria bacterium]|nr:hypothetical protein [Candidatus Rokubacteria bacterium]
MNTVTRILDAATATFYLCLAEWHDYVIAVFWFAGVGVVPSPVKVRSGDEEISRR